MKKIDCPKIIGMMAIALCMSTGCEGERKAMLEGTLEGIQADSVYLYRVDNEHYDYVSQIGAIAVTDGKFTYMLDSIQPALYSLSLQSMKKGEYVKQAARLFLEPKPMQLTLSPGSYKQLNAHVTGSALQEQYEAWQKAKYEAGNHAVLDSLNLLFYTARDTGNREEMERIRAVSEPYYESGSEQEGKLIKEAIEKQKGTFFGLYLYYTYMYQNHTFNTIEEINKVRNYLSGCDEAARQSVFYGQMEKGLDKLARCATGSMAPPIVGTALDGTTVALADFKGKYVLVDFWFSSCQWCRLETPYLLKAYHAFQEKGFTILGVSTDRREEDWRKAIEEDKSNWNQILLKKDQASAVLDDYCIVGFPHIILVDPDGKIVAKELRGDDLYDTVEQFVTGQH